MNAAIVIVSGKTSWSEGFVPYLTAGNISAVQRIIIVLKQAGIDRVVLVTSEDARELERHVAHMGAVCLENVNREAEMLDNIKAGLEYLKKYYDSVIITPVDVPFFSVNTVNALLDLKTNIAIPVYNGIKGHPIVLKSPVFNIVLDYSGGGGLDSILGEISEEISYIEVADPGVMYDVENEDILNDLERLAESHELMKLRPEVRISLAREQTFFGPGTQMLLGLVYETGSLRMACARMGISYSKGWKMIQFIEEQLGYQVVSSQKGGSGGGKSQLTDEGKMLVDKYRILVKRCETAADEIFNELFKDD